MAARTIPPSQDTPIIGKSWRILLAEDNLLAGRTKVQQFSRQGQQVVLARDGEEAVDLWKLGHFDLILMDVSMPRKDGYEATAEIRKHEKSTGKHIPIIALTAKMMAGDEQKCRDAGMDAYLAKPVSQQVLVDTIVSLMSSQSPPARAAGKRSRGKLSPFDYDDTLDNYDGDASLVKRILLELIRDCPEQLGKLRQLCDSHDMKQLQNVAHYLAGSLAVISAPNAQKSALALERAAVSGRPGGVESALARLETKIAILCDALRAHVEAK